MKSLVSARGVVRERDTPKIAQELEGGFDALLARHPYLVRQFEEAFEFRSKMAGVAEAQKGAEGIRGALAENLGTWPEKLGLVPDAGNVCPPSKTFIDNFKKAVRLLPADEDRIALMFFKNHQLMEGCSALEALISIFTDYVRRKEIYPY